MNEVTEREGERECVCEDSGFNFEFMTNFICFQSFLFQYFISIPFSALLSSGSSSSLSFSFFSFFGKNVFPIFPFHPPSFFSFFIPPCFPPGHQIPFQSSPNLIPSVLIPFSRHVSTFLLFVLLHFCVSFHFFL